MSARLDGHSLYASGFPVEPDGAIVIGYTGHGRCTCGEISVKSYETDIDRRRWYEEHKSEVRAQP